MLLKSPLEYYKENVKKPLIKAEYTDYFIKRYITGEYSKDPIFDTNEEKKLLNIGFIPGKIYTYFYNPLYREILDFYDINPLVFVHKTWYCENTGNNIMSGINLHFIPKELRVILLENFYRAFPNEVGKSIEFAYKNEVYTKIQRIQETMGYLKSALDIYKNNSYKFAYRNYIISRIDRLRYVEYHDWELIPFLDADTIIGKSVNEIYKMFWESVNKK